MLRELEKKPLQTRTTMLQYPMFRRGEGGVGFFCISKSGHDAGEVYVIVSAAGNFVHIANGRNRTIAAPKKKNPAHLFITTTRAPEFKTDVQLAKLIKDFRKGNQ